MTAAAHPIYFGGSFGWLHGSPGRRAALICPALGAEYLVLHRFTRRLAIEFAEAGIPALRFDYPGTGDSPTVPDDGGEVETWLAAIENGIQTLRRNTGATDVVLVGFQVGALLAACGGRNLPDVCGIAMIAPVANGRAYARELKLRASVQSSGAKTGDNGVEHPTGADLEINGFAFSERLRTGLRSLDIATTGSTLAQRYMLLGVPNWEADNKIAAALRSQGHSVIHTPLHGLADFRWHSTFATLPDDAFHELIEWCRSLPSSVTPEAPEIASSPTPVLQEKAYAEIPTCFGPESSLFGIYCKPRNPTPHTLCVVIGNHGANHHVGWGNMYVPMARQLAEIGISSFRFDFAGIGDSSTVAGKAERQLYLSESQDDFREAIDHVVSTYGNSVMLLGHCSGAYQVFYTAISDPRVKSVAMINLATFHWKPGDSLEIAERNSARTMAWYVRNLFRVDTMTRLARGRIDVAHVLRAMGRWLLARLKRLLGRLQRGDSIAQPPVEQHFQSLSARGTSVLLIYSDNDSGIDELALRGGKKITRLPTVSTHILHGADHNVSAHSDRREYFSTLIDHIRRSTPFSEATPSDGL